MKTKIYLSLIAVMFIFLSQLKAQDLKVKTPFVFQKHKIGLYFGIGTTNFNDKKPVRCGSSGCGSSSNKVFNGSPVKGIYYSYSFTKNVSFVFDFESSVLTEAEDIINKPPVVNTFSTGFKLSMFAKRKIQPNIFIAGCKSVYRDKRTSKSNVESIYLLGMNVGCGLDLNFSKHIGAFVRSKIQYIDGKNTISSTVSETGVIIKL